MYATSAKEAAKADHGKRNKKAYDGDYDPDASVRTDHQYRVASFVFFFIHHMRLSKLALRNRDTETIRPQVMV